jgi:alkaline phosphatase
MVKNNGGLAVALGTFDGFHSGHKMVIDKTKLSNGKSAVLLFDEHPQKVLSHKSPGELITRSERDRLLEKWNVKPITISFSEIMSLSYEEFFYKILLEKVGATALSCGVKADNYNVARIDGINVENMAEYASLFNMDVGIIATESIVGATPSGFASHANDRNDTDDLYNGHMSSSVDIYMSQYDEDLYTPARVSAIANNGFTHISTLAETTTNKYTSSKIFATFPKFDQYGEDNPNCPTLAEASTYAINYLDQKSDNGFFMMIEASHIDKYSHDNDFFGMVKEVRAFDDAVKAVLDWAKADGETLVIITADHETGGLVYNPGDTFGNGLFRKGNHTGANVRFFAIGFNEEGYDNGVLVDNTLLNHIMRDYIANQRKAKA